MTKEIKDINFEFSGVRFVSGKEASDILKEGLPELITEIEIGFKQLAQGKALSLPFINFTTPGLSGIRGHVHFKAGYVEGDDHFVFKYSGGFWGNREAGMRGSPDSGFFVIFNAFTGKPEMMVEGGDFTLTDYRTAAAGAVAAKYLSNPDSKDVGIIGNGVQAKLQMIALKEIRPIRSVKVWGRNPDHVKQYFEWMKGELPEIAFQEKNTIEETVKDVDVIITATPSSKALISSGWISKGTHITAIGACGPTMQELDPNIFVRADKVYADSIDACVINGDIHHAIEKGLIKRKQITGELGQVIAGMVPGREKNDEITVIDLVGLGVQDAKAGNWFYKKYFEKK